MQLKCIQCGSSGLAKDYHSYHCQKCLASYSIIGGIPRFVDSEQYSDSFGFEWNYFSRTQLDSANGTSQSLDTFTEKTGWNPYLLNGKRVLDVGCGMGRFSEICLQSGAEVYAIDLSRAVEAAWANLGHYPRFHVYQADVHSLPFWAESFDYIFSIGVLHHTPDTRRAFLELPIFLRPGGQITIWVYSQRMHKLDFARSQLYRLLSTKIDKSRLLKICKLAIPLYYLHRVPLVGNISRFFLPTSMHKDPNWRWLDTFDWYAPKYQWKHTCSEVMGWFQEAGLVDLKALHFPVAVQGRRCL